MISHFLKIALGTRLFSKARYFRLFYRFIITKNQCNHRHNKNIDLKELYTQQVFGVRFFVSQQYFYLQEKKIVIYCKKMLFGMTCNFLKNFKSFKEDCCFGNPNTYFPILGNTGQNNK